ncbi:hypothetical protein [Burkholderia ubonensis]|uniref:hypothetical protein n=1 Tax=Burkholderia ubonensis TaxID=101571 RepID=UPI0012F993A3|nr:hypothetical protein [Burkholderia ubonensis]
MRFNRSSAVMAARIGMPMGRSAYPPIFALRVQLDRRNVVTVEQRVQQVRRHRHDFGFLVLSMAVKIRAFPVASRNGGMTQV